MQLSSIKLEITELYTRTTSYSDILSILY